MWNLRVFVICVIMACATAFSVWLLFGDITVDGTRVPVRLEEMAQRADEQGSDYRPPGDVITVCRETRTLSHHTLDTIERVTGEKAHRCDFISDSWHRDAAYGIGAVIVLALLVFGMVGLFLWDEWVPVWLWALSILLAVIIGTWIGPDVWGRFTTPVEEMARFWHGIGAMASLIVGYVLANIADVTVPD